MTKRKKIPSPKIKKEKLQKIPISKDELEMLKTRRNEKLLFSFRFLDKTHEVFNLGNTNISWYISLLEALKELNGLTRNELMVEQRRHWEAHTHDWTNLKYCYDFEADFLEQVECLQVRLSSSEGRIHGFVIANRFYIVWLDPLHNLYPSENHGGLTLYPASKNKYEILEEENRKLKEENEILENLLEECKN